MGPPQYYRQGNMPFPSCLRAGIRSFSPRPFYRVASPEKKTMFGIGPMEMVIVGIIALLLFGKRLPEVAKGLGKSIVEFKRGMQGIEDEVRDAGTRSVSSGPTSRPSAEDSREEPAAPRFEPPRFDDSSRN